MKKLSEFYPDKRIVDVMKKLNKDGHFCVLIGGYIRDYLNENVPNDVDLSTSLTLPEIKKIFPNTHWTNTGFELGIARFTYKNLQFEVSYYKNIDAFLSFLKKRDFTINSFYFDGNKTYDLFNGYQDLKNKRIASLEEPSTHFSVRPQAYLRSLRLSSSLGFSISSELFAFLFNNTSIFHDNNENRIQQEGYKIIQSNYPLLSFFYLIKLGFISSEKPFDPKEEVGLINQNAGLTLAFLSTFVGKEAIFDFIKLFKLSKNIYEHVEQLVPYLIDESTFPSNPKILNETLLLKRIQYKNEPELLKTYLKRFKS